MAVLTITYTVPENAPDWFMRCVEDGDWGGIQEYAAGLDPDSINLT